MNIAPQTIGQRIRNFRKAKGLSQQDLELEINASFGHISRIESGKINPSKELLLKIFETLRLSEEEIRSTLGIEFDQVNKEEIKTAVLSTKEYIDSSDYPSYLADDYFFVHHWNKKILRLLNVPPLLAEPLRGANVLEIMFHPLFMKTMDANRWKCLVIEDLIFFMRMTNYFLVPQNKVVNELFYSLKKHPEFEKYWNQAKEKYTKEIIPGENLIYFRKGRKEECYYMSTINVLPSPRFRIIEYIPQK